MREQLHSALAEHLASSDRYLVAELDREGRVVDCNPGFVAVSGASFHPTGAAFFELCADELSPKSTAGCPRAGPLVIRFRGRADLDRFEVEVIETDTSYLVIGERVSSERKVMDQLARLNDEMTNLTRLLNKERAALQRSLERIRRLEGLIPICSYCHRIRNEGDTWQRLEEYIVEHSDASFTHGICPGCFEIHFPEEPSE